MPAPTPVRTPPPQTTVTTAAAAASRWSWLKSDVAIVALGGLVLFALLVYNLGADRALIRSQLDYTLKDVARLEAEVAALRERLAQVDALTTTNYSDIGTLKTKQVNDRAAIAALEKYHEVGK